MTCSRKTVLFEEKYNVNINDFSTTEEVDKFIEKKEGVVLIDDKVNIDSVFDKAIGKEKG